MYRNRCNSYKCECDCEQLDVLEEIQKGICKIKEGIKFIQNGLDAICCCKICEGIKCICLVEQGLKDVIKGLRDVEFECDYRSNVCIKEGICDLKDGVRGVQEGLCQLQKCCLCEGLESVQCGLKDLEQGLCTLIKGVNEISDERDRRRKTKCYK